MSGTPTTKAEWSLLLYCEACAVDHGGKMVPANLNAEDHKILDAWKEAGYVASGGIPFHEIKGDRSLWVRLSDTAWEHASAERRARAGRVACEWARETATLIEDEKDLK